jgi:two-component system, sensor histidine kinase SagS
MHDRYTSQGEGGGVSDAVGLEVKPKLICVCDGDIESSSIPGELAAAFDLIPTTSPIRTLQEYRDVPLAGIFVVSSQLPQALQLLESNQLLRSMPDGVVVLDGDNKIAWANECFVRTFGGESVTGKRFYEVLRHPEVLGPEFCPFQSARTCGAPSASTLHTADNRYFHIHASSVRDADKTDSALIVTLRDVTQEQLQQQKLAAIHRAGMDLVDLAADEVFKLSVDERIELLKSNILHYTRDLLNFDVIEIRLLDESTGELSPLLAFGMDESAAARTLYAKAENNGVTGFVAATGKSYVCEDITNDPLYLQGVAGARSSLTVPLMWHNKVIGTFNVESPKANAFSEADLQFLEIFSYRIAFALNTLELLVAQQATAAQASVEAIHSAVALPVDEILNDCANVMERYIGHEPQVVERLQRILRNARDIRHVIQKVGEKLTPAEAVTTISHAPERPILRDKRVLVVDQDDAVRLAAHDLLERYGCIVETAHDGYEALCMVRSCGGDIRYRYDAIISDIRLPDMSGHGLMVKLQEFMTQVPLILMTGFGWDPGHSIVKARQAGLHPKGILYKPFRLDQLLESVETIITAQRTA